jgi:protoheme IX farnesyltransferase
MSSVSATLNPARSSLTMLLRDYSELIKARITTMILMTTWCGFYLGSSKAGTTSATWTLLHTLLGVGLAAGGTAALNEAMERDLDARMHRTAARPLVTGRMSMTQGVSLGLVLVLGGSLYLALTANWLAAALTFATSAVYLLAYTPLKQVHPVCTFIGAFPGAMPPLLGWAAARGRLDPQALVLFAIVFFWQFPHFHSIAWLYREDYARAGIRMLPVVESDGRSTSREIVFYLGALLLTTLAAAASGIAGRIYLAGALLLGIGFFWFGWRLAAAALPAQAAESRRRARHLLQASVIYLPLLLTLLILNATVS